jgi:hypothetical protein
MSPCSSRVVVITAVSRGRWASSPFGKPVCHWCFFSSFASPCGLLSDYQGSWQIVSDASLHDCFVFGGAQTVLSLGLMTWGRPGWVKFFKFIRCSGRDCTSS